ncbi:MAG: multicopper oxidase domain-containing protein [Rhizomicrobium sp.]
MQLTDYFAASPIALATLQPRANSLKTNAVLPVQPAAMDFTGATRLSLELGAGVDATAIAAPKPIVLPDGREVDIADSLCLAQGIFWTLNGQSWPGGNHANLPPPLFNFERGERVVLEIENTTSRLHPIHLHGHTMTVLSASLLKRPVHRADTVLVLPNERVTVGFVADNPGKWIDPLPCDRTSGNRDDGMVSRFLGVLLAVAISNASAATPAPQKIPAARLDDLKAAAGWALFRRPWISSPSSLVAGGGVGPLYNSRACDSCHMGGGAGRVAEDAVSKGMVVRLGRADATADPVYGVQIQTAALPGFDPEADASVAWGRQDNLRTATAQLSNFHYGALSADTHVGLRRAPSLFARTFFVRNWRD